MFNVNGWIRDMTVWITSMLVTSLQLLLGFPVFLEPITVTKLFLLKVGSPFEIFLRRWRMHWCEGASCCYRKPSLSSLRWTSTRCRHILTVGRKYDATSRSGQIARQSCINEAQLNDIAEAAYEGSTVELRDDEEHLFGSKWPETALQVDWDWRINLLMWSQIYFYL